MPVDRAAIVATNFFHSNDPSNGFVYKRMSLYDEDKIHSTRSQDEKPAHYIFQGDGGKGFVIVAADDACSPIIGYSFDGTLPIGYLPENMKSWLDGVDNQIRYLRENDITATSQVRQQWQSTRASETAKELKTATWNQSTPYNERCPMDDTLKSLTGCVATATAIVMRYHKWPKEGKGSTEEYYTNTKRLLVPSRNLDHTYDWSNMPLSFEGSPTNAQIKEVAVLMADIGAAFKADYTSESTSAGYDIGVLYRNFGYSSSMRSFPRELYDNDEWVRMMKNEIDANRPVLYSGSSKNNDGHAFVIDGYDYGGHFHVNWGWGGSCNGFFSLNNLVPDNAYSFNEGQWAIVNVRPADDDDRIENWLTFRYNGLISDIDEFETGVPFDIELNIFLNSQIGFEGDIMLAVTDRKGNIKEILKEYKCKSFWSLCETSRVVVKGDIAVGDRIRAFYKSDVESEWSVITSLSENIPWEILIAQEFYLHELTSFKYDNEYKEIELKTKPDAQIKLYDPDGNDVSNQVLRYDECAYFETANIKEGKYRIVVTSGSESLELQFSVKY